MGAFQHVTPALQYFYHRCQSFTVFGGRAPLINARLWLGGWILIFFLTGHGCRHLTRRAVKQKVEVAASKIITASVVLNIWPLLCLHVWSQLCEGVFFATLETYLCFWWSRKKAFGANTNRPGLEYTGTVFTFRFQGGGTKRMVWSLQNQKLLYWSLRFQL